MGRAVLRVEVRAVALDDVVHGHPAQRLIGVLTDRVRVIQRERPCAGEAFSLGLCVAIQDGRERLAGDRRVRVERRGARTGDDALRSRSADGLAVPSAACHVGKRQQVVYLRFARLPVHHTKQIRMYFFLKVRSDLFFTR